MKAWGIKKGNMYFTRLGHEEMWTTNINEACVEWKTASEAEQVCYKGENPVALEVTVKLWRRK
jgi:hypothetical protein